jgi:hypothetical protein
LNLVTLVGLAMNEQCVVKLSKEWKKFRRHVMFVIGKLCKLRIYEIDPLTLIALTMNRCVGFRRCRYRKQYESLDWFHDAGTNCDALMAVSSTSALLPTHSNPSC